MIEEWEFIFMKKVFVILLIILFLSLGISYSTDIIDEVSGSHVQCPLGVSSHEIVYNTNGGSEEKPDYVSSMKPADTSLPTPTKDGYLFAGWYDNAAYKKAAIKQQAASAKGNKNYYAKWTKVSPAAPTIKAVTNTASKSMQV